MSSDVDCVIPLQHMTGVYTRNSTFLADDEYGRALDTLVKGRCSREQEQAHMWDTGRGIRQTSMSQSKLSGFVDALYAGCADVILRDNTTGEVRTSSSTYV
jgi:hypothetical protein